MAKKTETTNQVNLPSKACGKNMTPEECQTVEFNWRDDPKHETIKVKAALPKKTK
jgi:hypothetical protein